MITAGSDSEMDEDDEPVLDSINVMHDGGVNRIRVCMCFGQVIVISI